MILGYFIYGLLFRAAEEELEGDPMIGPPPPAAVAEAASANDAERFEEVLITEVLHMLSLLHCSMRKPWIYHITLPVFGNSYKLTPKTVLFTSYVVGCEWKLRVLL